ncbi:hypothetical protein [Gordonia sp. OPL2]|uniref:hypothetical protein n=1 Tax=Gordonia sp. OPL2 TaxID=2486274 RepID=UPI00165559A5|nr:hypothetical protein [Gordonia sp. OPL2]RPA12117.1 hypothetical protein EEB19_07230 [Gordonia sp. OPL2]
MGRRNRKPESSWDPENAARIRAGLAHGFHRLERELSAASSELGPLVDDLLDREIDTDPTLDADEQDELDQLSADALQTLDEYDEGAALAAVESIMAGAGAITWVEKDVVETQWPVRKSTATPAELLADSDSGIMLFEVPAGSYVFEPGGPIDDNDSPGAKLEIDGVFWWHARRDSDAEDDLDDLDDLDLEGLGLGADELEGVADLVGGDADLLDSDDPGDADNLVIHFLARAPRQRHLLHEAWRLPVVVDGASFVLDWDEPYEQDPDELALSAALIRFFGLLAEIRSREHVDVTDHVLPAARRTYVKAGWLELEPLQSVSVASLKKS